MLILHLTHLFGWQLTHTQPGFFETPPAVRFHPVTVMLKVQEIDEIETYEAPPFLIAGLGFFQELKKLSLLPGPCPNLLLTPAAPLSDSSYFHRWSAHPLHASLLEALTCDCALSYGKCQLLQAPCCCCDWWRQNSWEVSQPALECNQYLHPSSETLEACTDKCSKISDTLINQVGSPANKDSTIAAWRIPFLNTTASQLTESLLPRYIYSYQPLHSAIRHQSVRLCSAKSCFVEISKSNLFWNNINHVFQQQNYVMVVFLYGWWWWLWYTRKPQLCEPGLWITCLSRDPQWLTWFCIKRSQTQLHCHWVLINKSAMCDMHLIH